MSASLYERLGGSEGITRIAHTVVDNHMKNPAISNRFRDTDVDALKNAAATFFIAGTGGPDVYRGKDLLEAHQGMNITATEFMAVLDDALDAMQRNDVAQREQEEVLFALYSMRGAVVMV